MTLAGFPHSGIAGSRDACSSPTLFAAYHALLRLSVPRHSPCALVRLTGIISDPALLAIPVATLRLLVLASSSLTQVVKSAVGAHRAPAEDPDPESASGRTVDLREPFRWLPSLLGVSRKEVIQPQVPLRLPCYDFVPLTGHTFDASLSCELGQRLRVQQTQVT